jgi:hypothetical protein
MALRRNGPLLAAATIGSLPPSLPTHPMTSTELNPCPQSLAAQITGIAAGYYAFNQPLKQYSDDQKSGSKDFRSSDSKGQSQTATSTDTGSKGWVSLLNCVSSIEVCLPRAVACLS